MILYPYTRYSIAVEGVRQNGYSDHPKKIILQGENRESETNYSTAGESTAFINRL